MSLPLPQTCRRRRICICSQEEEQTPRRYRLFDRRFEEVGTLPCEDAASDGAFFSPSF